MVADGLLTRQRYREVPPRVDYELTERARELTPVLGALARWGLDWTWSLPREGEDIDIGAILRLSPGLLHPSRSLEGTVAIAATGKQGAKRDYVLIADRGEVSVAERAESDADARVSGTQREWIAAFGPDMDRSGLRIEGNRELAEGLLAGLTDAIASARSAAA
jgi:hypothetical protein